MPRGVESWTTDAPSEKDPMLMYPEVQMFVGGEWLGVDGRNAEPVFDPATGEAIGQVPLATPADLDRALQAAEAALPGWAAMPPFERGRLLAHAAALIRQRSESIARIMTLEQGKPLRESRIEVNVMADIIEWMAEEGRRAYGRRIPARQPGWRWMTQLEPVGVVAAFAPWNFPGTTPARKLAGPLAAGCCCILKASEETPGTAIELVRALHDAGIPPGVCNVVFGVPDQVSRHLIGSPIVRKVTFTGSTAVGKHIGALSAGAGKPATLELGGHAPVLVFEDAEVGRVARMTAAAKFRNAGQVCVSPTRIFVHDALYDTFVQRLVHHVSSLVVGPGIEQASQMGPLANARRVLAMQDLLQDAVSKGAKVLVGGAKIDGPGFFFQPTLLADVPADARILHEEPFGPVALLLPFREEDDALRRANALPYGLGSYVFTSDADRCLRAADALRAGLVGINTYTLTGPETPWGGVGDSGYGREGGSEGLQAYMVTKFISQAPAASG